MVYTPGDDLQLSKISSILQEKKMSQGQSDFLVVHSPGSAPVYTLTMVYKMHLIENFVKFLNF